MSGNTRLPSRINHYDLTKRSDYFKLGDVCYFGSMDYWDEKALAATDFKSKPWVKQALGKQSLTGVLKQAGDELILEFLKEEYIQYREKHRKEPDWVRNMTKQNQRYLRYCYLLSMGEVEPLSMLPSLPFSGFGYVVEEDGLTERVIREFGLWRLQGIKQLGFLHYPTITKQGASILVREFPHNRYVHSLDVRAVAKLILYNNRRSEVEHTLLDIAALTHDTLTPAGGDSIKWIDQKLFDEDLHYPELMMRVNWANIPEAPPEASETLPQIILNRGVLGQVLDIADKIAYVGRDLCAFYVQGPELDGYKELTTLLKQQKQPGSLWDNARIRDNQLYFANKNRLVNFLMIRAVLFSRLYQNSASRFKEMFVKTFVEKRLYETGKLTRDMLLRMQDMELNMAIDAELGTSFMDSFVGFNNECLETFGTEEEALKRKKQLLRRGRSVIMLEKAFTAKAGVHFMVDTEHGLMPLSEADPENAQLIRDTIRPQYGYALHYLDTPKKNLPKVLQDWQDWC